MRRILLVILFPLIFVSAKGQNWAATGAVWHYSLNAFNIVGNIKIEKMGDTLINGKNCDVLKTSRYVYDYVASNYYSYSNISTNFTYQDSGKVFFWINNSFRKLYDFNVSVGDTVFIQETFSSAGFCNAQDTSIVDSVGTMIINGDTLKYYHLNPLQQYSWHYLGRIVEKIGCMGYMFPENNCELDYFETGPFRCYSDSAGWNYETGVVASCDFILGVNERYDNSEFTIFPNPSSGIFSISSSEKIVEVEISNVLGEKVYSTFANAQLTSGNPPMTNAPMTIDLSSKAKGIYFVKVLDENGNGSVKKIILQ